MPKEGRYYLSNVYLYLFILYDLFSNNLIIISWIYLEMICDVLHNKIMENTN